MLPEPAAFWLFFLCPHVCTVASMTVDVGYVDDSEPRISFIRWPWYTCRFGLSYALCVCLPLWVTLVSCGQTLKQIELVFDVRITTEDLHSVGLWIRPGKGRLADTEMGRVGVRTYIFSSRYVTVGNSSSCQSLVEVAQYNDGRYCRCADGCIGVGVARKSERRGITSPTFASPSLFPFPSLPLPFLSSPFPPLHSPSSPLIQLWPGRQTLLCNI